MSTDPVLELDGNNEPRWISRLPWVAIALLASFLVLFVYRFSGEFGKPDVWGQLGDFVGGTINPLLAFLSLLVLLQTMREQGRQLTQTRRHAILEELQRLISTVSTALDELLRRPVHAASPVLNLGRSQWAVTREAEFQQMAAKAGIDTKHPISLAEAIVQVQWYMMWAHDEQRLKSVGYELKEVRDQLQRLDWCLSEFLKNGGAPVIARFYGVQYKTTALVVAVLSSPYDNYEMPALTRLGLGTELVALRDTIETVRTRSPAARNGS
jgi:hypothetical protein